MGFSKHTNPPWQYGVREDGSIWFAAGDMRPGGGSHWQGDFPGTEDDARLITAAPDLLHALKYLLAAVKSEPAMNNHKYDGVGIVVNAAIAKAEGRS